MEITKELISYLKGLSRFALTEREEEQIADELGELLAYMKTLDELDTEGTAPSSHCVGLKNVMRADEVKPSLTAAEITSNAKTENGCFVVPLTVEQED